MDIDTLVGAFRDFDQKGEKEASPILDQFLTRVAKTGETMIQWSLFKSYFLYKLEKVMDDFNSSCPEQTPPVSPYVEYVPFDQMKQRILKIVEAFSGVPFTIQRLCELLIDPRRNYSGTEKFLRGVEKNVMVVSFVCPASEKKGAGCLNRMNGVMFPGSTSDFSDRSVNGPGFVRPLIRPKAMSCTNGLPDSTENPGRRCELISESLQAEASPSLKSEHRDDEDGEMHEAKRLRFEREEEEEEEEEDGAKRESPCVSLADEAQSTSDASVMEEDLPETCQESSSTRSEATEDRGDGASGDLLSPSHVHDISGELERRRDQNASPEETQEGSTAEDISSQQH